MSDSAKALNERYLNEMLGAGSATVLGRIRDIWWTAFVESHARDGAAHALDRLDEIVGAPAHRVQLIQQADAHASGRGFTSGTDQFRTAHGNFIKSNIGKMFERFVCLALAHSLLEVDSGYCVLPWRNDTINLMENRTRNNFRVNFTFGDGTLMTYIDADAFAFRPGHSEADVFMMSVKSTLKDRFHNVPFWNLLRRVAISGDFPEVSAFDPDTLRKLRYVAICSDFAEEQPDFGTDAGARNLLQIDASLLDGAYVTSSRARGLPDDCTDHLGEIRQHAFYKYSCFYSLLATAT